MDFFWSQATIHKNKMKPAKVEGMKAAIEASVAKLDDNVVRKVCRCTSKLTLACNDIDRTV